MDLEERIDFYKKTKLFENEIVRVSENTIKELEGTVFYSMIHGILMDSNKHAFLLDGLIKLLSEEQPTLDKSKYEELEQNLQEHIDLEKKAIQSYKKILELKDPLLSNEERMIASLIYEEEKKHHQTLGELVKLMKEQ